MGDEVVGAAVEVVGCHDVVARLGDVLQGVGDGCRAAGHGQARHTALERRHAVLEHGLCGVGQAAVDVAGIAQAEAVGSVLRVVEHIARGLVDRHRTGIGGRVGLLLSDVELERLEVKFECTHSVLVC